VPITEKPQPARITTAEERAPLYAAYTAGRARGEDIGYRCPDDSIIQYAVRAYDREKYGTEALMLPDWLVDLIEAAQCMEDELGCDELGHLDETCKRCYWDALIQQIPERTMTLAKQAIELRLVATRPSLSDGGADRG
jgi:hypothetical protein